MRRSYRLSPTPLVERIASDLESRIVGGLYTPGQQLPAEARLAAEFGVSRPTLRDAVARLEARGLLRKERGRGTYVAAGGTRAIPTLIEANLSVTEMIQAAGLRPGTKAVTASLEAPAPDVVSALGIRPHEAVLAVRRVRIAGAVPAVLSIDYLPLWIQDLPLAADAYYGSLYELLESCCGEPVGGALARIEPLAAGGDVARLLEVESGQLLLALHQTHELRSGRRVLYSTDYFRNDIFTIYVRRVLERSTASASGASGDGRPDERGGVR